MSGPDPVGISSQDARLELSQDDTPDAIGQKVNDILVLIRDDIQRLAGLVTKSVTITISSGNHRLPMTMAGIAQTWAISDTATTGSTGAAYHTLSLLRNGVAPLTQTYDTRRTEIPAYLGGCYLGETAVDVNDVLAVSVAVTGAPAPTLSTDNFCLLSVVRGA